MSRRRSSLSDEQSWCISTLILVASAIILYFSGIFERSFFLFVFAIPALISALYCLYLALSSRRKRLTSSG